MFNRLHNKLYKVFCSKIIRKYSYRFEYIIIFFFHYIKITLGQCNKLDKSINKNEYKNKCLIIYQYNYLVLTRQTMEQEERKIKINRDE